VVAAASVDPAVPVHFGPGGVTACGESIAGQSARPGEWAGRLDGAADRQPKRDRARPRRHGRQWPKCACRAG